MNRKEKELFLALCSFKNPDKNKVEHLLTSGAATPEVLGHLFANRMAGVAYTVLSKTELLAQTDREFRNSLSGAWRLNEKIQADFMGCINFLSAQLNDCGVPYALLKGAYLCGKYPIGCRTSNDIDVLICPEDVGKVSTKLRLSGCKQGYLKNGKFIEATRQQIIESKMTRGETVPFIKETRLPYMPYLEIDLNFSLDYKNSEASVVKEMLARTQRVQTGGTVVRTLGEADFFLHLCAHLYKEATTVPWIRMKRDMTFYKFCDVYMLVSDMTEETAREIVTAADEHHLARELAYAVNAVQEFFGVGNPTFGEFLKTMPQDSLTRVVAPAEKKMYRYTEPSVAKRFFAKDRMKLLEECVR